MTDDIVKDVSQEQGQASTDETVKTDAPEQVVEQQPVKEEAMVPSHRLREETEKRKAAEAKVAEIETLSKQEKAQVELQYAKEIYGEAIEDQEVQAMKEKYPDLSYKQILGALGLEVPTLHAGHASTPGRATGSISGATGTTEYKISEIQELAETNPSEYKRIMADYASKKITIVQG